MSIDFEQIKDDIVSVGKEVGTRVSDMSAVAKLKLDIHNKESFLEKQFAELGRAYYLAHKNDEEIPEKAFFEPIKEAEAEIARLKDSMLSTQGAVICKNCGLKQAADHVHCVNCGARLREQD